MFIPYNPGRVLLNHSLMFVGVNTCVLGCGVETEIQAECHVVPEPRAKLHGAILCVQLGCLAKDSNSDLLGL